jgi:hypothetical protein
LLYRRRPPFSSLSLVSFSIAFLATFSLISYPLIPDSSTYSTAFDTLSAPALNSFCAFPTLSATLFAAFSVLLTFSTIAFCAFSTFCVAPLTSFSALAPFLYITFAAFAAFFGSVTTFSATFFGSYATAFPSFVTSPSTTLRRKRSDCSSFCSSELLLSALPRMYALDDNGRATSSNTMQKNFIFVLFYIIVFCLVLVVLYLT